MHRIRWSVDDTTGSAFVTQGLWPAPPSVRERFGLVGIALAPQQALALTADGPVALAPSTPFERQRAWLQWEPDTAPSIRRLLREPTGGDPEPALARLTVVLEDGSTVAVGDTAVLVGRHPGCELALEDPRVSAFHALLLREGETLRLIDLASRNGVLVDGTRVQQAVLTRRCSVRLGGARLMVVPELVSHTVAPLPSKAMGALVEKAQRIARVAVPVLITGESGVGKEILARQLHQESGRPGAFVAINAAVLGRELATSELFGHVRGAFTGADQEHDGAFHAAHEGTLFLDEIAELSLDVQAELLRVVELGRVRRLGETHEVPVDVRIVTATHRDLAGRVRSGHFREDLFHRLCVVPLHIPPLRDRLDDVIALAEHFLSTQEVPRRLSPEASKKLLGHRWPGNARELLNTLRRTIHFTESPVLEADDIAFTPSMAPDSSDDELQDLIHARVVEAYARSGNNVAATARQLGLRRTLVHRILQDERRESRETMFAQEGVRGYDKRRRR